MSSLPLHIFTVASELHPGMQAMLMSAERHHIYPQIMGMGDQGLSFLSTTVGRELTQQPSYALKTNSLHRRLRDPRIKDNDLVLMVDAYDIIFTGGEEHILAAFRESDCDLLFSAERLCEKICCAGDGGDTNYESGNPQEKYLCAGVYMGKAGVIRALLPEEVEPEGHCDQTFWGKIWKNYKQPQPHIKIKIDGGRLLCHNMAGCEENTDFRLEPGGIVTLPSKTRPPILHFNGFDGKRHLFEYYRRIYGVAVPSSFQILPDWDSPSVVCMGPHLISSGVALLVILVLLKRNKAEIQTALDSYWKAAGLSD